MMATIAAEDTSDHLFTTIERTIVDWCEANGLTLEERRGEWVLVTESGDEWSVTELTYAVCQALARVRAQGGQS